MKVAVCRCSTSVLKNFTKFRGIHLYQSAFLAKLQRTAILLEKRLQHRYSLVNYKKFLRTIFLQNTSRLLMLEEMQLTTKEGLKTTNCNKVIKQKPNYMLIHY